MVKEFVVAIRSEAKKRLDEAQIISAEKMNLCKQLIVVVAFLFFFKLCKQLNIVVVAFLLFLFFLFPWCCHSCFPCFLGLFVLSVTLSLILLLFQS